MIHLSVLQGSARVSAHAPYAFCYIVFLLFLSQLKLDSNFAPFGLHTWSLIWWIRGHCLNAFCGSGVCSQHVVSSFNTQILQLAPTFNALILD